MAKIVDGDMARKLTGVEAPRDFSLDASVIEHAETHKIIREDIKMNRAVFRFPDGFNRVSLFEECRALTQLDDFDTMYDLTMQLLENRDLEIYIRDDSGNPVKVCEMHIVDRYQDLRSGYAFIDEYPVVITWLTEFISAYLTKKYPLPGKKQEEPQPVAAKKKKTSGKQEYPQTHS